MKDLFEDPPRWREHSEQSNLAERTIGQDLRAIRTPPPLSEAQMARMAARMRPSRVRHARPWLVLAAALVLGVATAASATHLHLLPRWLAGASAPPPDDTSKRAPERRAGRRNSVSGATSPLPASQPSSGEPPPTQPVEAPSPTPATTESPSVPAVVGRVPRRSPTTAPPTGPMDRVDRRGDRGDASPPAPVASVPAVVQPQQAVGNQASWPSTALPPPPTGLAPPTVSVPATRPSQVAMLDPPRSPSSKPAQDFPKSPADGDASRLLADAIRLLRADGQPQAALGLLERHAARLAQSPYGHEALLIRAEALLALKRDAELLRLLDGMPLGDVAASRTLLTTRGRLRAAAKRCAEAVADFDRVLDEAGHKDRQALLGRALCREAMGDRQGAKLDREAAAGP